MSRLKVNGVWRSPAATRVKVNGSWRLVSVAYVKVNGSWRISTLAGAPSAPVLAYTAQGTFTINNYDAALTYTVTGATRTGNQLTAVTNGATIRAAYAAGATQSAASTMYVANHGRVLTGSPTNKTDTGCGPRPTMCCDGGQITNVDGSTCDGSPGSLAPDNFCGGSCNGNCYQKTISCYNWYWTDYSSSGYTLIGSVWGKAVNG